MSSDFLFRLLSSLIGGVLLLIIQHVYAAVKEGIAPLTGVWEDEIYDENNVVVKRDQYHIRQNGTTLSGTFSRIYPEKEQYRVWNFSGKVIGEHMIAYYWPKDQTVVSHGIWYVALTSDFTYEGTYMRMDNNIHATKQVKFRIVKTKKKTG